jgi:hypothetical protein
MKPAAWLVFACMAAMAGCTDVWGFVPLTQGASDASTRDGQAADAPSPRDGMPEVSGMGDGTAEADGGGGCDGGLLCVAVLMGGDDGASMDDTWLWDGKSWSMPEPATFPPARTSAMAGSFDGSVVLFGGQPSPLFAKTVDQDTWTWTGTTWNQGLPMQPPPGRAAGMMASQGASLVLFGGYDLTSARNDTWLWDGTNWTEATPALSPSPRSGAAVGRVQGDVFLFGGWDGSTALDDTWEWNGKTWAEVKVTGSKPPARYAPAHSTLGGKLVLFGGLPAGCGIFDDTWEWDGTAWTEVATKGTVPPARYSAAAATLNDEMVVFGGFNLGVPALGDTWLWNGEEWRKGPVAGPEARGNAAMSGPEP